MQTRELFYFYDVMKDVRSLAIGAFFLPYFFHAFFFPLPSHMQFVETTLLIHI